VHRIKIESLAYGGYGVARIDGEVCFVPYGVPGDELLIRVASKHKGVSWADILEIYEPSPHRREPACGLFQKCGGCQWLHIQEDAQVEWKRKIVESAFQRIGKFEFPAIEVINQGIHNLGYRSRAQFHFEYSSDGMKFGFHEPRSHGIVDLDYCPLLIEPINRLIPPIKSVLREIEPLKYLSSLRIVANPSTNESLIWLDLYGDDESRVGELADKMSVLDGVVGVDWGSNKAKSPSFELELPGCRATVPAGSFSQASFYHNEKLIELVMNLPGDVKSKRVMDIYCGWGNLSLPLAVNGALVWGYDNDASAIDAANSSVRKNGFKNCVYEKISDLSLFRKLSKKDDEMDMIILDPPRTGAKAIAKAIAKSKAKGIIYVSCDPNTLARDLRTMIDAGRKLQKSFLLDMIPQTYHIETVNLLM